MQQEQQIHVHVQLKRKAHTPGLRRALHQGTAGRARQEQTRTQRAVPAAAPAAAAAPPPPPPPAAAAALLQRVKPRAWQGQEPGQRQEPGPGPGRMQGWGQGTLPRSSTRWTWSPKRAASPTRCAPLRPCALPHCRTAGRSVPPAPRALCPPHSLSRRRCAGRWTGTRGAPPRAPPPPPPEAAAAAARGGVEAEAAAAVGALRGRSQVRDCEQRTKERDGKTETGRAVLDQASPPPAFCVMLAPCLRYNACACRCTPAQTGAPMRPRPLSCARTHTLTPLHRCGTAPPQAGCAA